MQLETLLKDADWSPSRRCDTSRLRSDPELGFVLHEAAERFLSQFLDLSVEVPITGFPGRSGFVQFTRENVNRMFSTETPVLEHLGGDVFPVGTTGGHTFFVLMDHRSNFYLLEMGGELFGQIGSSDLEALECLCGGDNGRVDSHIIQDNRFTGHVIRDENQHEYWELEDFQELLPVLPLESLCPLRYPPTWEAMTKVVQQTLCESPIPKTDWHRIKITSGGALLSPKGETFFVTHRENTIFIREQAGFTVVTPPYGLGIPKCEHLGHCVPVAR